MDRHVFTFTVPGPRQPDICLVSRLRRFRPMLVHFERKEFRVNVSDRRTKVTP